MTDQELKILCLRMLQNLNEAREAYRWLKEERAVRNVQSAAMQAMNEFGVKLP